jgi:hypothetical protein
MLPTMLWMSLISSGERFAVDLFAQARNAAQQEEEEEHADSNLRKVTI